MLGGSGAGGKGGALVAETPPPATDETPGKTIDVEGDRVMDFSGGNGGSMAGRAGNGGDGLGDAGVDSKGGDGGKCLDSGAGGRGGSIRLEAVNGKVILSPSSPGASVNGGDNGAYSATSGNGGNSTGTMPGGVGGDSGSQGNAGGATLFNPRIMTITI